MQLEIKIDSHKIDELITSTHTLVKMDEWIDDRISTIILPHMLNFLLYIEVLAQQNVKRFDPKLTDVIFYFVRLTSTTCKYALNLFPSDATWAYK